MGHPMGLVHAESGLPVHNSAALSAAVSGLRGARDQAHLHSVAL